MTTKWATSWTRMFGAEQSRVCRFEQNMITSTNKKLWISMALPAIGRGWVWEFLSQQAMGDL